MVLLHQTATSLRLCGDDLDPDEITRALRHLPDMGARIGAICHAAGGIDRRARTGTWLRSVDRTSTSDLDARIAELLAPLTNDMGVWKRLTACFKADVFCGFFLKESNEGISLGPQTLAALGSRGLIPALDIYDPALPG